jgi:hypothetical protein
MEKKNGKEEENGTGGKSKKKWEIVKKKDLPDYTLDRHVDDSFLDRINLINRDCSS